MENPRARPNAKRCAQIGSSEAAANFLRDCSYAPRWL